MLKLDIPELNKVLLNTKELKESFDNNAFFHNTVKLLEVCDSEEKLLYMIHNLCNIIHGNTTKKEDML